MIVFRKIGHFERSSAFKGLLFHIAYNMFLSRRETINKRAFGERAAGDEFASDTHQEEIATKGYMNVSARVEEPLGALEED